MTAKALNVIIRKPSMVTMSHMIEQISKMVAAVKTTAWGGNHGYLALVLDNEDYLCLNR